MYLTYNVYTKEITRVDIFNFPIKSDINISFGENTKTVECDISDDILLNLSCYLYDNGVLVYSEELAQKQEKQRLIQKKEVLLKAFESYKTDVVYGIRFETDEQKATILEWYKLVLELNADAITNPPEKISQYL